MATATVTPPRAVPLLESLGLQKAPVIVTLVVGAACAFVPLVVTNRYLLGVLILILIFSILNLGWNLTIGTCGIWNFGQLALFALGGYGYGILASRWGASPWLGLLVGCLLGAVAGVLMIIPALHLKGIYAALLTFCFAEVFRLVVINDTSGLTGGPYGLSALPGFFDGLSPLGQERGYFWLGLALTLATLLGIWRLMNSPFGISLTALRDSPAYALGMGVNQRFGVIASTAVSGFLAGLAGALYASYYGGISPTVMGLGPMSFYVLMIVIGGLGTSTGPIVGTAVVMALSEMLRNTGQWRYIVLGAILLLILAFQPAGLTSLAGRILRIVQKWMAEGEQPGVGRKSETEEQKNG
jgi:branched-chain amino acid transport system permease protein